MNVLGYSGLHHSVDYKRLTFPSLPSSAYRIVQGLDSAAAFVRDGEIVAAAAQERFSGEKATGAFPVDAIRYCLESGGLETSALDAIAHGFAYQDYRDLFERSDAGKDLFEAVLAPDRQRALWSQHFGDADWTSRLVFVPHHLAHGASAFYPSGFDNALILVVDGMGEQDSTTVSVGSSTDIEVLRRTQIPHSLGLFYGVFCRYLGFEFNLDEYKVMGLAPYGNPRRYFHAIGDLVQMTEEGLFRISVLGRNQSAVERETYEGTLEALERDFGPRRRDDEPLSDRHADLAAGLQAVLQQTLLAILRRAQKDTGLRRLCMAGGVALNCAANGVIYRSGLFDEVFVQPAAGDDGSALGAALAVEAKNSPRVVRTRMSLPTWGPDYSEAEIVEALSGREDVTFERFDDFDALVDDASARLECGEIIGWFQDGMEFGPRALGNRSILADPRREDMRDILNARIKQRESFRPFAPAVIAERAAEIFEIEPGDEATFAHMLFATPVRPPYRGKLPAATHCDHTARVQTVNRATHLKFWMLLNRFGSRTGLPVLVNTSFNVKGQPIVRSPSMAIDTLLRAKLDVLFIGPFRVLSALQRD